MKKSQKRSFLKTFTTQAVVASLITSPFAPITVFAQSTTQPQTQVSTGMKAAVDITKGLVGMTQQMMMQQQMQQQQMMMMQQMQQMKPQMVPSKYFGCPVGPSISNMPSENFCPAKVDASSAGMIQTYRSMRDMAEQNALFFEKMLNEAQNSPQMVGVQCLEDRKKRSLDQMQDQINSLQDMADKISKENQAFREQNKQLIDQMKDVDADLNGNKQGLATKNARKFSDLISPACAQTIGDSTLNNYQSGGGLIGLRKDQSGINDKATRILNTRAQIEKDVVKQIGDLKKSIEIGGLEQSLKSLSQQQMPQATKQKITDISNRIDKIKSLLASELDYNLPLIDKNFETDSAELRRNAESFFKKRMINDCARTSIGLDNRQLLDSLKHSTSTNQDLLARYRSALAGILGSEGTPEEDKIRQIQELDKSYGNKIQVKLSDSSGRDTYSTPYSYLNSILKSCEEGLVYNNIEDTSTGRQNADGTALKQLGSQQQRINAGVKYLEEITAISKNAVNEIANLYYDEVINCRGSTIDTSSCNESAFDMNSSCLKKAVTCGGHINKCYREIDNTIKTKQNEINSLAATYDKNVAQLVANQERFLGMVKSRVAQYQQFMATTFPGTKVDLPGLQPGQKDSGLFVKMPEKELATQLGLGVYLRGGGSIDEFDKLPEKVLMLKNMLADQKQKTESEINDYIGKQKQAAKDNQDKWKKVAEKCQKTSDTIADKVAEANAANAKAAGEMKQKQDKFCNKFRQIRQEAEGNPVAGCGKSLQKLSDTMEEATSGLVGEGAQRWTDNYRRFCAQVQATGNQRDNSESGSRNRTSSPEVQSLAEMCKEESSNHSAVVARIIDTLRSFAPEGLKSSIDEAGNILKGNKITDAEKERVKQIIDTIKASSEANKDTIARSLSSLSESIGTFDANQEYDKAQFGNTDNAKDAWNNHVKGKLYGICVPDIVARVKEAGSCTTNNSTFTCSSPITSSGIKTKGTDALDGSDSTNAVARIMNLNRSGRDIASDRAAYNSLGLGESDVSCTARDDSSRGLAGSLQDLQNQIFNRDQQVLGIGR